MSKFQNLHFFGIKFEIYLCRFLENKYHFWSGFKWFFADTKLSKLIPENIKSATFVALMTLISPISFIWSIFLVVFYWIMLWNNFIIIILYIQVWSVLYSSFLDTKQSCTRMIVSRPIKSCVSYRFDTGVRWFFHRFSPQKFINRCWWQIAVTYSCQLCKKSETLKIEH